MGFRGQVGSPRTEPLEERVFLCGELLPPSLPERTGDGGSGVRSAGSVFIPVPLNRSLSDCGWVFIIT